jgi:hypothetical protein
MDIELIKHLNSCPSCARLASAERILASALRQEREAAPDPETPFNLFRSKVEALSQQRIIKEKSIMSRIKSELNRRPKLVAGFGLAVFVLLFVALVPFPYTKTVGYMATFNNIDNINKDGLQAFASALDIMGYGDAKLTINDNIITIANLPTREAAREAAAAFQRLTRIESDPAIIKMTEQRSGSIFAQAIEHQRTIEIDAVGKTDAEIEAEIARKLSEAGYQSDVTVTTTADGQREIKIKMDKQDSDAVEQENIVIKCGDTNNIGFGLPIKVDVDDEGKTDDEVCAEVKAKLAEQGVTDAQVTVSRDADGKRKVEVKVKREENK